MNATTSTTSTSAHVAVPVSTGGSAGSAAAAAPVLSLPGSGRFLTQVPATDGGAQTPQPATLPETQRAPRVRDAELTVPLDQFAKRGGPDASVKTATGVVYVHAVFQMDPTTKEMSVSIVDEAGRLVRMIPPDSVARMIAAMATYRGR